MSYLPIRIFDYAYVDRFDKPIEWRINKQLRARSFEATMSTSSIYLERTNDSVVKRTPPKKVYYNYPFVIGDDKGGDIEFKMQSSEHFKLETYFSRVEGVRGYNFEFPYHKAAIKTMVCKNTRETHEKQWSDFSEFEREIITKRTRQTFINGLISFFDKHNPLYVKSFVKNKEGLESFHKTMTLLVKPGFRTLEIAGNRKYTNNRYDTTFYTAQADALEEVLENIRRKK